MPQTIRTIGPWILLGIVLGGGAVEVARRSPADIDKRAFAQNLKCKTLADEYVKANSEVSPVIGSVGFSRRRNSCVAAMQESIGQPSTLILYSLRDLTSEERLFMAGCKPGDDCSVQSAKLSEAFGSAVHEK